MTQPEFNGMLDGDPTDPTTDPAPAPSDTTPTSTAVVPDPSVTPKPNETPTSTGDFTTGSFWQSPSTWVALASYLLPIASTVFHKDLSSYAQAIAEIGPVLATAVLLAARSLHKREVVRQNAHLAQQRASIAHERQLTAIQAKAQTDLQVKLALVQSGATAKQMADKLKALQAA